jgi:hypothetical protein
VGTVTRVGQGAELFLNIRVKPAANLGRIEEVLVITKKEEKEPAVAEGGPVRAVDILAQRLPSVPDKLPANDANKADTNKTGDNAVGNAAAGTQNNAPAAGARADKPARNANDAATKAVGAAAVTSKPETAQKNVPSIIKTSDKNPKPMVNQPKPPQTPPQDSPQ